MVLSTIGSGINNTNAVNATLDPQEKKYNEIKIILDSGFSDQDKRGAIDREMRKGLDVGDSAIDAINVPGAKELREKLFDAKRDILAAKQAGYPEDVLKSIIMFQLQKLQADPYRISLLGGVQPQGNSTQNTVNTPMPTASTPSNSPENNVVAPVVLQEEAAAENNDAQEAKTMTPEQKIQELEELLKQKTNVLKELGPDLVRVQLITHPHRIPKYLRRKMRNKYVNRKSRDPIDWVYALKEGRTKRFVSGKKKRENAYKECQNLIKHYEKIVEDNKGEGGFKPELFEAQTRVAQLKIIEPMLAALKPIQSKLATSAQGYGENL